ncbi:anaphase-promoting complex subunit 4 [Lepeophtheirus salmonis]|uniref:anaphase-promoting complex subunit 4 n=1 Tax=Lepeophtheirus salmonis TaxID=72036 RepID=UPI001AE1D2B3|nr:anaphase-promoting complex subunit 4-like [Lepeophtheirus salmonis]
MSNAVAMRQLEERKVDSEVLLAVWSPKIDILALYFSSGEVTLYRIVWQKIWSLQTQDPVMDIVWRSDSKVLALGYSTKGKISIFDMESNVPIHELDLCSSDTGSELSFLKWITLKEYHHPSDSIPSQKKHDNRTDSPWTFLNKFPDLTKAYSYNPSIQEETENCKKLDSGGIETLLISGTKDGVVNLYFNGFLYFSRMDVREILGGGHVVSIRDAAISHDLNFFSIIVSKTEEENEMDLVIYSMPLISMCFKELVILSEKYCILSGTTKYMSDTIKHIKEAWEEILIEMDTKLASYAKQLPEGGMTADFLELLMFGTPSAELEHFLLQELTEKGLKKLGHSIEVSYSNVQRLVLKYLHTVSQSLNFHLAEIVGIVKASEKFKILGIKEYQIDETLKAAFGFWNKGIELQQVLDESMKNFKAFFRWIYVEILKLSEETVSEELCKVSQQDIQFIAEFLKTFAVVSRPNEDSSYGLEDSWYSALLKYKHKYLEKVGQYIKSSKLYQPVDRSKNPWYNFLKESGLTDFPLITQVNEDSSLIDEHINLNLTLNKIFTKMKHNMTDKCQLIAQIPISRKNYGIKLVDSVPVRCSQFNVWDKGLIHGVVYSSNELLLYRLVSNQKGINELKALKIHAGNNTITSCHFYTGDILSLLVSESQEKQKIVQLPLGTVCGFFKNIWLDGETNSELSLESISSVNIFDLFGQGCYKELENICEFSVSGPRKVAVFIFNHRKRLRIYEMEVEDDDDDDENDTTLGNSNISSDLNTSY